MSRILTFVTTALVALSLFSFWYFQQERVIKRKLDNLIEDLNFTPESTRTTRLIKSSSIASYFDVATEISSPIEEANGNFSHEDLSSGYAGLAEYAREINIVRTSEISYDGDKNQATLSFEADVKINIKRWIPSLDDSYHVTTHWRKTDKGWVIHSSHWSQTP
ncbi:MAG TPA: hypothetical protein DDW21_04910 [Verrucomicrobiales bacterium]|jgi:hypothetical protein|nr:MAG: hypothetical protein B9S37_09355 [Verrucomicrobiae bacterium Tous-C3TDCM]PAZ05803.1 MAG: hypothetical protein CAK88_07360 [Verrucomicrobiae bacterium AMD-G2]HBE22775.1 hypothetical protein [Verrucomicrobiales bacterium]